VRAFSSSSGLRLCGVRPRRAGWANWADTRESRPDPSPGRIGRPEDGPALPYRRTPTIPAGIVDVHNSSIFAGSPRNRRPTCGAATSKNDLARRRPPRWARVVHVANRRRAKTRQRCGRGRWRGATPKSSRPVEREIFPQTLAAHVFFEHAARGLG
jgi:hypothetical protein